MSQNPLDLPVHRPQRLIHKGVIGFFQHAVTTAVKSDRELGANERRAGGVDLIQDGKHTLLHDFGQHLRNSFAKNVSPVPVWLDEGIGKLVAVPRPAQDGHRGRGLHEEIV